MALLISHDKEKVEEGPENQRDEMCLSNSVKHCCESVRLDSETTGPATATGLAHLIPSVLPPSICDISVQLKQKSQPSPDTSLTPSLTGKEALLSIPVKGAPSRRQRIY